jgi:hypothetical protein
MRTGTTFVVLRSLMAAVLAALGVIALLDGRVVVGGLLVALAILNVTMTITMSRRRRQWREQIEARRGAFGQGEWRRRPS